MILVDTSAWINYLHVNDRVPDEHGGKDCNNMFGTDACLTHIQSLQWNQNGLLTPRKWGAKRNSGMASLMIIQTGSSVPSTKYGRTLGRKDSL